MMSPTPVFLREESSPRTEVWSAVYTSHQHLLVEKKFVQQKNICKNNCREHDVDQPDPVGGDQLRAGAGPLPLHSPPAGDQTEGRGHGR